MEIAKHELKETGEKFILTAEKKAQVPGSMPISAGDVDMEKGMHTLFRLVRKKEGEEDKEITSALVGPHVWKENRIALRRLHFDQDFSGRGIWTAVLTHIEKKILKEFKGSEILNFDPDCQEHYYGIYENRGYNMAEGARDPSEERRDWEISVEKLRKKHEEAVLKTLMDIRPEQLGPLK